jgi:F0F1-type ATP synthase delta subunit
MIFTFLLSFFSSEVAKIFKRVKESGNSQEWSDNLAFLSAIMQDESLAAIVNNPRVEAICA